MRGQHNYEKVKQTGQVDSDNCWFIFIFLNDVK